MKAVCSIFLALITILAVSCPSTPKPAEPEPQPQVQPQPPAQQVTLPPPVEVFNPETVTEQHYTSTMEEVKVFIDELNNIIRRRDYTSWRAKLSREYFTMISSPEFLADVSEQPAMRTQRPPVVLKTAEDYFIRVVVPSRANSRVDSIEFIGRDKVIAYSINTNRAGEEVRLRLYYLEKINNSWIIID